jgi:hypothetical protein
MQTFSEKTNESSNPLPVLYAVQNTDGQWFRRKGYGGYGKTWVSDFSNARIYTKIGPARGVITFFATHYKDHDAPKLVQLCVGEIKEIDETDRIKKSIRNKEISEAKREVRRRNQEMELAQKQLQTALGVLHKTLL